MSEVPSEPATSSARTLKMNTIAALMGDGLQLVFGLASFFLLADHLGTDEFGIYGAIIAIATFAIPVGSVGAQSLLMLDMAKGMKFDELWSRAVSTVVTGGMVTTAIGLLVQPVVLPQLSRASFGVLFASQTVFFAVTEFCVVATQAHRRLSVSILLRTASGLTRLISVVVFVLTGASTVEAWSPYALVAWAVASVLSLTVVRHSFGPWPAFRPPSLADVRRGAPYSFGSATTFALDAVDRPMLVALGDVGAAGVYNAGYRLAQVADVPIAALVRATDADFFAAGNASARQVRSLARKTMTYATGYGVAAGVAIFFCAPVLPWLLGDEWNETVDVLRLLSVLPFFRGLRIFPANALTAIDRQDLRNWAFVIALCLNIPLNAVLIPRYSWTGAVVATIASEILMGGLLWRFLYRASAAGTAEPQSEGT